jgi:hypothetical protein
VSLSRTVGMWVGELIMLAILSVRAESGQEPLKGNGGPERGPCFGGEHEYGSQVLTEERQWNTRKG